ncbi:hypothetical protein [uncultured Hymenobacter sp.]|uniref:hypothetical protein n=1 Tax=uncultured Hymenobacter sp. TaxID=170016 RepID=UPI0035CBD954
MSTYTTDETGKTITAYPLQWPVQFPRTSQRSSATFKTLLGNALKGLYDELRQLGATGVIVSSNLPVKANGQPYAQKVGITDPGVAVYFTYLDGQRVLASDKWAAIEHNVQALRKTVEALRGLDRWGCSDILRGTFSGLLALAPARTGAPNADEPWPAVLGLPPTASEGDIRTAARRLLGAAGRDATLSEAGKEQQQERIILARGKALAALSK